MALKRAAQSALTIVKVCCRGSGIFVREVFGVDRAGEVSLRILRS